MISGRISYTRFLPPVPVRFADEKLLLDSFGAFDGHPRKFVRLHENRCLILRRGIDKRALIVMLPKRLVTILLRLAGDALVTMIDALFEDTRALQFLHRFRGTRTHIARSTNSAELQHRHRVSRPGLGAVISALREITQNTCRKGAVLSEVGVALNLISELIEIVMMPRREETAVLIENRKIEISYTTRRAFDNPPAGPTTLTST